jgi:hypothetical protein
METLILTLAQIPHRIIQSFCTNEDEINYITASPAFKAVSDYQNCECGDPETQGSAHDEQIYTSNLLQHPTPK